ncbi:hypothetical protein H312_03205 [Anncaliia algerae PRA339]|uniref:Ubiquitin-like protease family profile domain-containing protein n=1 Tax=Anncaliia algerae PRA339 TaxID=1288291 RepID=A0A059EXE8_9MICR|nr:hypothetical protein H312_03205 [Anncaliia algerae PRA339]
MTVHETNLRVKVLMRLIKEFIGMFYKTKLKKIPFKRISNLAMYCNYIKDRSYINDMFGINITNEDFNTLLSKNWLNDKIINFYFELMVDHFNKEEGNENYYTFSTYLYTKLAKGGNVKSWVKNINLTSYKLIFIPINTGNHWLLFCWDKDKRCLECYDSLYCVDIKMINIILKFLDDEFQRNNTLMKLNYKIIDCYKQENGSDCGVYCCMFGKNKLLGTDYKISGHLSRLMIMHEIYIGKIIYKNNSLEKQ